VHKISQLKHENIIEFIGLHKGPDDVIARTYLMEILDGSLYTLLDMVGGLYNTEMPAESTEAIVVYTSQMINAVHYLHTQHTFCHRDIKPANFLIRSRDGLIKLSDFGTAKDVSGFEKSVSGISGSLQYVVFRLTSTLRLACFALQHPFDSHFPFPFSQCVVRITVRPLQ
jgi:serine/threonine protein kinase